MGKRNKQAKDKQLSLSTIIWSKVKFMTRDVRISRKGHRIIKPTQDTFVLAWRKKAQTSIRVSIIASDNVISKA